MDKITKICLGIPISVIFGGGGATITHYVFHANFAMLFLLFGFAGILFTWSWAMQEIYQ